MTRAIPQLNDNLGFERVKQRVAEMRDEIEQEKESSLTADEKIEVASEMMGSFIPNELADGAEVSIDKAQDKIDSGLPLRRLKQER